MKKETLSTSEKEIPKINLGLEEKYKEEEKTKTEPLNPGLNCIFCKGISLPLYMYMLINTLFFWYYYIPIYVFNQFF